MSYKRLFSRSLAAAPGRLHVAAHSHHLWPDAAFEGHAAAAEAAARLADHKWGEALGEIAPALAQEIAQELALPDPNTIVFAPNTHEFILRLVSTFPWSRQVRLLSTTGEFHSFSRQAARWAETGKIALNQIAPSPIEGLPERLIAAARSGPAPDIIFVSHVFFGSGEILPDLAGLVAALADLPSIIVIDGYHGYMAVPTSLGPVANRAFYLAGGYKYAMAGEDACFLHAPPGSGPRPENTGWFAAFAALADARGDQVGYGPDGQRFAGATFDPTGLYRALAVRRMLRQEDLSTAAISAHVRPLQDAFLAQVRAGAAGRLNEAALLTPTGGANRARFLAFRHLDAARWQAALGAARVITDVRSDVIRFGFGLYHDPADIEALVQACRLACA